MATKPYNMNTDYQDLINKDVQNNDLASAAIHEYQRNSKITGQGLDYAPTYNYHSPSDEALFLQGAEKRSGYVSPNQGAMSGLTDKITNNSYSGYLKGDEYAALKSQYERQGSLASEDVLGKVSAATGGLASSYAATAASQQYNEYMQGLFNQSYSNYMNEANADLQRLSALQSIENSNINLYEYEQNFAYNKQQDDISLSMDRDKLAMNQNSAMTEDARSQINAILKMGGTVSQELWDASGYDPATIAALSPTVTSSYAGGNGGNGGNGDNDTTTPETDSSDAIYNEYLTRMAIKGQSADTIKKDAYLKYKIGAITEERYTELLNKLGI